MCPIFSITRNISLILGLILVFAPGAAVSEPSVERFFGVYQGVAVSKSDGEVGKRDLGVTIKPHEKGFTVDWVTVTRKADTRLKRKRYSINFKPTHRPNIYASAMRTNMFGQAVPLDPLRGDPYVWSRISGRTLTVYAMLITDGGGYEMQTYERSLTDGGLELKFSRVRDGVPMRVVTGTLEKVGNVR